jgi:pimeloyl-ACP methyl ester carboxylesterase
MAEKDMGPTPAARRTPPAPPAPHFPRPYARPSMAPDRALAHVTPDGARIAAFVYGGGLAGAPVLVLHGNGEEHGIFGPVVDAAVRAGHPVVALDSRAQGRSTRGTAPLTYELMAQDAAGALEGLGLAPAHVLGFSDGAIEGLLLARDRPELVLSLVSVGANLTPEGVRDDDGWLESSREALEAWADWWREGEGASLVRSGAVDPALLSPTPDEAAREAELLRLMEVEPHVDAASLAAVRCPTTVVAGEHDVIEPSETRAIFSAVPDARLVVLEGLGHSVPKQDPRTLARLLLETVGFAERR